MFSDINPFIADISSDKVQSSIVNFTMANCRESLPTEADTPGNPDNGTSSHRRKRAVETLPEHSDEVMAISLNLPGKEASYVNGSTIDIYKMLYHTVNMTEPVESMVIAVYPLANESLTVYVRLGNPPTPDNYNWTMNVSGSPGVGTGDARYSLLIPAEDMRNVSLANDTVNIGIRRTGDMIFALRTKINQFSFTIDSPLARLAYIMLDDVMCLMT